MTPVRRLLDPGFVYHGAASHTSPEAFRERMAQRAREAEREAREKAAKIELWKRERSGA